MADLADLSGRAVAALRAGRPVILPTDTVYGLACVASDETAAGRLYALKGRAEIQPSAVVAASLDGLFALLPELDDRCRAIAEALLPGSVTLVVPNPAGRLPWLNRLRPEAIGVRVPQLPEVARGVVEAVAAVVATSANLPGGVDPRTVSEIPEAIRAGVDAEIDVGPLPGIPSTVVDVTGEAPVVLRAGAVPGEEVLARIEGLR